MKALIVLIALLLSGCQTFSTKFSYSDGAGGTLVVEMPKEVDAKDLKVSIDARSGLATIEAREWNSRNAESIAAQGKRESDVLEKVAAGAAQGAVKGLKSGL